MFETIRNAVRPDGGAEIEPAQVSLAGEGTEPSRYAVSDLAQFSIAAAVDGVLALRRAAWGVGGGASVERGLANLWFRSSVRPQGWELPAQWDPFAGDYRTRDGWIRLHTNAPHHRAAALKVLGEPGDRAATEEAVRGWDKAALEQAVVAARGCAAEMLTEEEWRAHPQGRAVAEEPVAAWSQLGADAPRPALSNAARPLAGVRVLDLTRVLAGPACTRFLAALGADVLRIDPPGWDEEGVAIEMTVGKRCAGLDLRREDDRAVFERLLSGADILVHGYRSDALEGLGFGRARRTALNPGLIDVALDAYGWTGPWAARRGFDSLVQMSSGIAAGGMAHAGADRPTPLPYQALDHATGYLMAAAALQALTERVVSGRVFSARLSLARQARLLQDMPTSPRAEGRPAMRDDWLSDTVEQTSWGPARRLRPAFRIEGVEVGWDRPARRLRSDPAEWANGRNSQ